MKKNGSISLLHFTVCIFAFAVLITSTLANATLKFSYTSDLDGPLGYFTIDESAFYQNLGSPQPGWLKNQYIEDLSFSFRGDEWGVKDINRNDYTVFYSVIGQPLPQVQGGSGALATLNDPYRSIVLYSDGVTNFADVILMTGNWSTSYITPVPEAESYSMMLIGLGLMGFMVRRGNKATTKPKTH